jgi:hypothetical protein
MALPGDEDGPSFAEWLAFHGRDADGTFDADRATLAYYAAIGVEDADDALSAHEEERAALAEALAAERCSEDGDADGAGGAAGADGTVGEGETGEGPGGRCW